VKVGFDTFAFRMHRDGGISRYFAEMVPSLLNHSVEPIFIEEIPETWLLRYPKLAGIKTKNSLLPSPLNRKFHNFDGLDIFHNTYYKKSNRIPKDLPMALTIHDFTPELHPQFFPKGNPHLDKNYLINQADLIFCISATTRNELFDRHPALRAQVFITPLATSIASVPIDETSATPAHPYVLTVGRNDAYKSVLTAVEAISLLELEKLVLFGSSHKSFKNLINRDSRFIGMTGSDSTLKKYIENASCLIFTSLSEGFGLPILEAITLGCPVVASDLPVFRELFGDAILYAEAQNPQSFADQIMRLRNPGVRNEYTNKGMAKSLEFSWENTAMRTAEGYRTII
jgi:glycosyltransferase involved in cell wall biosynthesis